MYNYLIGTSLLLLLFAVTTDDKVEFDGGLLLSWLGLADIDLLPEHPMSISLFYRDTRDANLFKMTILRHKLMISHGQIMRY